MAIAALVTWVFTAGFGFFMLSTWISGGGARADSDSHFPPPVVFAHFLLAAGGLVVWIVYVLNDVTALAWIAFVDLLVVAIAGDVLVLRWTKGRRAGITRTAKPPGRGAGSDTVTVPTSGQRLAEQRIPTPVVAVHGLFAVATVVLVLLSALEVGGS